MKRLTCFALTLALAVAAAPAWAAGKPAKVKACGSILDAPGSYVLTKNLTPRSNAGAGADGCIRIEASNVTLDLGGYNIDCQSNGLHGISVADGANGITLRNGSITRCAEGIAAGGATGLWIEAVLAVANQSHGIRVGPQSTVVRCISFENVGYGAIVGCPTNLIYDVLVGNYNPYFLGGSGCNVQHVAPN